MAACHLKHCDKVGRELRAQIGTFRLGIFVRSDLIMSMT
jgi:hypothetical protein